MHVDDAPSEGEQRIYTALINLANASDSLASDMKWYSYPSTEDVQVLLKQDSYSSGGARKKAFTAELKVQLVENEILKIMAALDSLKLKICDAQEACYYKDMYIHTIQQIVRIKEMMF